MHSQRSALIDFILAILLCLLFTPLATADSQKPPKVRFNLQSTPLQEATDQQIEQRKKNNQDTNPDCDTAIKGNKHDDIVKHCKVPKVNKKDAVQTDIRGANKKVRGIRVETETTYECDSAEHCGMPEWPGYVAQPELLDPEGGDPQNNAAGLRVRRVLTINSAGINNDLDCVDSLTGDQWGGFIKDENGKPLVGHTYSNGHEKSCFDSEGKLKKTLVAIADGCKHANGTTFETAECESRNYTTLEERIDEDPPAEAGAPAFDRDGDGAAGEDGPDPLAPSASRCVDKGGTVLDNGSCDFGRKVRLEMKGKMNGVGKKGWKIDANGNCDNSADGDVECGKEARRVTRHEWYALRCPENAEYIDGRCLVPTSPEEISAMRASGALAPDVNALTLVGTSTDTDSANYAMMGFTWALPKVEWGINESQEVCIFFCFEVFSFRFGYEFDLAFGLRLPVKVEVTAPDGSAVTGVLAEQEKSYVAKLTPVDFTVQQYKDFCVTHRLVEKGKIESCDRFAFPDYYWSQIVGPFSPNSVQGSEFVAQAVIWAGLQLNLLEIPVIDWSVGVDFNLPAMCTMWKVMDMQVNPIGLIVDLAKGNQWLTALDDAMRNCATFVTPFGYKKSAVNPSEKLLRVFPFLSGRFTIDADCTIAKAKGWVTTLGSKQVPLCTHLSFKGAGIGLRFTAGAGSTHIGADWSVAGDARPTDSGPLDFYDKADTGPNAPVIGPVRFENYAAGDDAQIKLNNFTYHLDTLQFGIEAAVQILNYSLFSIPVYTLEFEGVDILSLHQHPGTDPITLTIPVKNYGLTVHAATSPADPMRIDEKTLLVKPGEYGQFQVSVKNEGTVTDSFSHFVRQLTNVPQAGPPFLFVMDHNNDHDCTDLTGKVRYRGYPYDLKADDCYTVQGILRSDRLENLGVSIDEDGPGPGNGTIASRDQDKDGFADEDPANDDWLSLPLSGTFFNQSISSVPSHSNSSSTVTLGVMPFLHPTTAPGLYPVSIKADSMGAITAGLHETDASGIKRTGAEDTVFIRVQSFFDPKIALTPLQATVRPGDQATFAVEVSNGGNDTDTLILARTFADSNRSACTLTTLGTIPAGDHSGCPYRALVTQIPAAEWTNIGSVAGQFGPLTPLAGAQAGFTIRVPREWVGMQDTTYELMFSSQSSMAPVHNDLTLKFNVLATKESMTRYIVLEVAEFLAALQKAEAQGIRARGAEPVTVHPITMMVNKALEQVIAGQSDSATKTLSSASKVMAAVNRMVNGAGVPEPYASDWKARTAAMLSDMTLAQAK